MIRKPTLVLLVIFVVMAFGVVLWQKSRSEEEASTTPAPGIQFLFETGGRRISGIVIYDSLGGRVELQRLENDTWTLIDPADGVADETRIQSAVSEIEALRLLSDLESLPEKDIVGLDTPAYYIKVIFEDGQQKLAAIGNATPTGSGYYVSLDGGPVWVVNKMGVDNLVELLDDPPVIRTPTPTPTSVPEITSTPQP